MPEANLSCVLWGPGKVRFADRPIPKIENPDDVLIRIAFVGVCGSDVHFWKHGGMMRKVSEEMPLVMGHEASGIVDSVGAAVTRVKPGDRVAIEPGFPCRRCRLCAAGRYQLCPDMKFAASPPDCDGTLARFFKIPQDFAYKIPDSLSLEEAVLMEPLSVAVHAVRLSGLTPGQKVLIQGSGTIGLLSAAVARAFGASSIVITDVNKDKLDFAKKFVPCHTFAPGILATPEDNASRLKSEANFEDGADVVLECTGVEASIQTGILVSAAGGVIVQVGMGKPTVTLPLMAMFGKEIVFKTSFRYGPGDYAISLELLETGRVNVKPLISSTVPFEKATEAWEKTARGEGIKNLIKGQV